MDKLREENKSKASLEDLYDRVTNARNQPIQEPPRKEATLSDIDSLIERRLAVKEQERQAKDNLAMVKGQLKDKLGDNYQDTLKRHIEHLDLTQEEADTLASTKPRTFLKMLGLDSQREPFQAPPSNTNISTTNNAEPKRTWTYYQDLKKSNPKLYYDPKTNVQMVEDYKKLGRDFEDGNFQQYGDSISNFIMR